LPLPGSVTRGRYVGTTTTRSSKEIVGASCFVLRFATGLVGVTAAHVIREYQKAKAATPSLVCQLHLMPFDLDGALVDINDDLDIATFAISERDLLWHAHRRLMRLDRNTTGGGAPII
jgi:hypothetical protein